MLVVVDHHRPSIRERFAAGRAVVLGHRDRDLEVARSLAFSMQPGEALAAEHLQAELRRVALADVVDDVDVEVRVAAGLLDLGTSSGRNQPRWLPPTALTSMIRGRLSMSAAYAAS